MRSLDKIAKAKGTDKSSELHNYCEKYEKYLPFNRLEPLTFLEIGVLDGESLATWREYYPNATIIGIDINPDCKKYEDIENRVFVEIGSQDDPAFLKEVVDKWGPFDIILDDGSHMNHHVIFSFEHLFSSIKPSGVYVVEDACTSYWAEYGGGTKKPGTMIEYFKDRVDEVNFGGEWQESITNIHARREDLLIEQFKRKGYNFIGTQIESLNFLNSLIIITKR